jgi:predicted nucleic acid-binding protein
MSGRFADTNVLLYLTSGDLAKAQTAERLLDEGLVLSVQVLNEFAHVARRKFGLSWAQTNDMLGTITSVSTVVPLTLETHRRGLALAELHRFATYDAMIVAAAELSGCDVLYSEDMHAGMLVAGRLRIVNPFV